MKREEGATIIEYLAILGALFFVGYLIFTFVNPIDELKKSRDGQRKRDLAATAAMLNEHYLQLGRYPQSSKEYRLVRLDGTEAPWGGLFLGKSLPKDPDENRWYVYIASPNGQTYLLYANVEKGELDPQVCAGGLSCPNVAKNVFCGKDGILCNYGISSGNVTP
ncbi:MAG: type II secretion system protein GspG [Candidatus Levybacteria bacterium]|nr:type II secretion system protein GspG [Candidatus Levybacteria bacterium]